jgi:glucose/arabinose dehydrogenase
VTQLQRRKRLTCSPPRHLSFLVYLWIGNYGAPTKVIFSNDGTLFASNKDGIVYVASPGEYDNPSTALDLEGVTCENGERGMQSVAPHPDFGASNPFLWVMYNYNKHNSCDEDGNTGPVIRLSRFTCNPTAPVVCDRTSETVYMETASFPNDHHNGGDVNFGKDGKIYATIGDGGEDYFAQDLFSLFGSIIRLDADNTVPDTNPFAAEGTRCGTNGGYSGSVDVPCSEIFAYGVRNPFRFAMNPNVDNVEFFLNDVGASTWEEVNVGGDNYYGANYGWPHREGPCNHGRSCDELCAINTQGYMEPIHFYMHNTGDGDAAITAGAFVPPTGLWPASYQGKYIYGDFVQGELYRMDSVDGRASRTSCPVQSSYQTEAIMSYPSSFLVSAAFSPFDGHLYFLTRELGGRLHRIKYVGNNPAGAATGTGTSLGDGSNTTVVGGVNTTLTGPVNRAPQPIIKVSSTGGPVGTTVVFDGTQSTDPDATNTLSFEWDFNGDGEIDSYEPQPSYTYAAEGVYDVTLKVRDGWGGRTTANIEIGIGEYPQLQITVPAEGETFSVGQVFILTGKFANVI